jgi:hypothetical protein
VPPSPGYDPQQRRIAAWLELTVYWNWTVAAAYDARRRDPYTCAKFLAEAARIWLWVARGERVARRDDVLRRALVHMPEEERPFRRALELLGAPGATAERPLAELLPAFVRVSAGIARRLMAEVAAAGATRVELVWGGSDELVLAPDGAGGAGEPGLLPLADWLAVSLPTLPDETFRVAQLDPADPASLASATVEPGSGPYAALHAGELLVFPQTSWGRILRSVQCPATDPVSFALVEGRSHAAFPDVPGWSANDWARRAVGEHRAWLGSSALDSAPAPPGADERWMGGAPPRTRAAGRLLTAARAALFLASLRDGQPELALSAAAVAGRLGEYSGERGTAEDAFNAYRAARVTGADVPQGVVDALSGIVRELPAYAG